MLIVGMTSDTGMRQRISPHIHPPGFWPSVSPNRVILGGTDASAERVAPRRGGTACWRLPPCMSSSSTAGGIQVVFSELVYGVLAAKRRGVVM
jgi:hypothetical protein